jgi:hypothetical protein
MLMNDVWYHAAKLLKATQALEAFEEAYPVRGNPDTRTALQRAVLEFAADVGNCAMFVADVTGALTHSEDDLVGEDGEETVEWSRY